MPTFYKIDKERRFVLSTASGVFTLADAVAHQQKLFKDPDFDPSFSQIADFTQVTRLALSADEIRRFAQTSIYSSRSRRALVMPNEMSFGLGRMYEILRDLAGQGGIRVFHTVEEAVDWVFPEGATG